MDQQNLSSITVYNDLLTVLKERGLSDAEVAESFAKLTAQAEMEVVEELMGKLTPEQLNTLESLPDNSSASEVAQKLGLDADLVDTIRAEKTAQLIADMAPKLND